MILIKHIVINFYFASQMCFPASLVLLHIPGPDEHSPALRTLEVGDPLDGAVVFAGGGVQLEADPGAGGELCAAHEGHGGGLQAGGHQHPLPHHQPGGQPCPALASISLGHAGSLVTCTAGCYICIQSTHGASPGARRLEGQGSGSPGPAMASLLVLGVMVVEEGEVSSVVRVAWSPSVSSPGDTEAAPGSSCSSRAASHAATVSDSGVSSTEMDLTEQESSLERLLEEAAWEPYPLDTMLGLPWLAALAPPSSVSECEEDSCRPAPAAMLSAGATELSAGATELSAVATVFSAGATELSAGATELSAGTVELPAGVAESPAAAGVSWSLSSSSLSLPVLSSSCSVDILNSL